MEVVLDESDISELPRGLVKWKWVEKWKGVERCGDCQRQNIQLFQGIRAGNFDLVSDILDQGADPEILFQDNIGFTYPLEMAIIVSFKMMRLLLQHGANPNGIRRLQTASPLGLAQFRNRIDIELLLLDYGANPPTNTSHEQEILDEAVMLFSALWKEEWGLVKRLMSNIPTLSLLQHQPLQLLILPGRKFDFVQAFCEHTVAKHQQGPLKSVITKLQRKQMLSNQDIFFLSGFQDYHADLLLNYFILGGDRKSVEFLLQNGISLQAESSQLQPLHAAILIESPEIVQELLHRGVPVGWRNEGEVTDLHLACRCANDDIARILLEAGANVEARDALGLTTLLHACHYGNGAVVRLLLKSTASKNVINLTSTKTPTETSTSPTGKDFEKYSRESWHGLDIAAHRGYTKIVRLLLQCGAHVSLRTKDGKTALDLAITNSHFEVALLLLKRFCPFVEKSLQARIFLTKAIEGCQTELVDMLILRGVQYKPADDGTVGFGQTFASPVPKPLPDSSIKSLNLVRSNKSMALLTGKMESLLTQENEEENQDTENKNEDEEEERIKKPQICTRCLKFFHRIGGLCTLPFPIAYEPEVECKFCQLVWESIPKNSSPEQEVKVQFFPPMTEAWERPYLDVFEGYKSVQHMIRQVPESWDKVFNLASQIEDENTGSPAATLIATKWLENCLGSHRQCNPEFPNNYFPTRVLDVLTPDPVLRENLGSTEPYLALSHRWGTSGLPTTTIANIQRRKHSIPINSLSRTMQDAITITRNLGFRYLWVDALSIIQDSKEDWQREASTMRDVYRRATLTIAVSAAEDHSEGIFNPRTRRCIRPIRFEEFLMPHSTRSHYDGDGYLYIFPSTSKSSNGIRPKGPLDERKWILQEQLLSPRILYYGKGELFWDCLTISASESSPITSSLPTDGGSAETWAAKIIRRALAAFPSSLQEKHLQDAWLLVTINYSRRKATKRSDTLIAIEGVMEGLKNLLHAEPLAGMWNLGLWRQLTWWIDSVPTLSNEEPENDSFQSPSWSWLSAQSTISYHNTIRGKIHEFEELRPSVEILDFKVDENKSRSNIQGKLRLKGYMFPYRLTKKDLRKPEMKIWQRINKGRWLLDGPFSGDVDIQCLVLAEDDMMKILVCLCLVECEEEERSFRRVGLCHWDGGLELVRNDNGGRAVERRVVTVV